MVVHKYRLPMPWEEPTFTLQLPHGAITSLQLQDDRPTLWYIHHGGPTLPVSFEWVATGEEVPYNGQELVGTLQFPRDAGFVGHLLVENTTLQYKEHRRNH